MAAATTTQWHQRQFLAVVLLPLVLWLLWSALVVDVDTYDGFATICNSLCLTGESAVWDVERFPALPALMAPARFLSQALGLHGMDVRPYHLTMALLTSVYLATVLLMLQHLAPRTADAVLAFAATVPTFVFFSYAPFVNNDIVPGALVALMLVLAYRYRCRPGPGLLAALSTAGAVAALFKPTFGIFWVAVLATAARNALRARNPDERLHGTHIVVHLGLAAAISALLYWIALGTCLRWAYPGTPLVLRPLHQMQHIRALDVTFPWWVYLRNLPAYGLTAIVLLVPALWRALRAPGTLRHDVAVTWLLCFAAMHLLRFREVRYIAFLAPLTAVLVLDSVTRLRLSSWRLAQVLVLVLLLVDMGRALNEAVRLRLPFYRHSQIRRVLAIAHAADMPRYPLYIGNGFCTMPPLASPLAGDRYHRMFHLRRQQVAVLMQWPEGPPRELTNFTMLQDRAATEPHSAFFYTHGALFNPASWRPALPAALGTLETIACTAEPLPLAYRDGHWCLPDGSPVTWAPRPDGTGVELTHANLPEHWGPFAFPCTRHVGTGQTVALERISPTVYGLNGITAEALAQPGTWRFYGYRKRAEIRSAAGHPGTTCNAPLP